MKLLILITTLLFSTNIFAANLTVQENEVDYKLISISAEQVKGVNLTLVKEIVREDCNAVGMNLNKALYNGQGDGWYDRYIIDVGLFMTEMFCPLEEPVTEIIKSEPQFFKSFTNPNVDGEVKVQVMVPASYDVIVEEVK